MLGKKVCNMMLVDSVNDKTKTEHTTKTESKANKQRKGRDLGQIREWIESSKLFGMTCGQLGFHVG